MAFTEANRVQIRKYLGYPQIYLQADPRLESAITSIQAIADGGTRPNPSPSAAETDALATLANLQAIDASLVGLAAQLAATAVGTIRLDAAREDARLRALGRMFVGRLAHSFDTEAVNDEFSSSASGGDFQGSGLRRSAIGRRGY